MHKGIFQTFKGHLYKLSYWQLGLSLVVSAIWLFYNGRQAFWSALLGGSVWMISSWCFAAILFSVSKRGLPGPHTMLMRFYLAVIVKLIFSIALICLILWFVPILVLPFFSGYAIAVFSLFLLPWFDLITNKKEN